MNVIFDKRVVATGLIALPLLANAKTISGYLTIFSEPSHLLLALLGCGLVALGHLRQG